MFGEGHKSTVTGHGYCSVNPYFRSVIYSKCPKILYTESFNEMAYADNTDLDQTAPE